MSFLKSLGKVLSTTSAILPSAVPVVSIFNPKIGSTISEVASISSMLKSFASSKPVSY